MVTRYLRGTTKPALIAAFLLFAFSSPGQAAPLDLNLQPYPDIFSWFIGAGFAPLVALFLAPKHGLLAARRQRLTAAVFPGR